MTLDAYLREHPEPTEDEVARGADRQPLPLHGLRADRRSRPAAVKLRSKYDREILLLALPALGALAVRAAVRARRHRDRRPPRHDPARLAGDRGDRALHRVHDLQLPHLRHDGAGRAPARRGPRRRRRGARVAGAVARARASACCCSRCSSSLAPAIVVADGRRGRGRRRRGPLPADRRARRAAVHARLRRPGLPARDRRPAHAAADPGRRAHRQRHPRAAVRLRLRLGPEGLARGAR